MVAEQTTLAVIARLGTSCGNLHRSALSRRSPRSLQLARNDAERGRVTIALSLSLFVPLFSPRMRYYYIV